MHMCSQRYPLEATQLDDVEVPQLSASRFAVLQPSNQLGRPTSGPTPSRAFCGTTIGPWLVQRTYSHVHYSPDQKNYKRSNFCRSSIAPVNGRHEVTYYGRCGRMAGCDHTIESNEREVVQQLISVSENETRSAVALFCHHSLSSFVWDGSIIHKKLSWFVGASYSTFVIKSIILWYLQQNAQRVSIIRMYSLQMKVNHRLPRWVVFFAIYFVIYYTDFSFHDWLEFSTRYDDRINLDQML